MAQNFATSAALPPGRGRLNSTARVDQVLAAMNGLCALTLIVPAVWSLYDTRHTPVEACGVDACAMAAVFGVAALLLGACFVLAAWGMARHARLRWAIQALPVVVLLVYVVGLHG